LVAQSAVLCRTHAYNGMHMFRTHRNMIEEAQAGHAGVVPEIVGRHAAFIAPKNVYPAPIDPVGKWRAGQKLVYPRGGGRSRKRNAETAAVTYRLICDLHEKLAAVRLRASESGDTRTTPAVPSLLGIQQGPPDIAEMWASSNCARPGR